VTYRIHYSPDAESDIKELFNIIAHHYKSPLTAGRYVQGLYNEIMRLSSLAESLPIQTQGSLLRFGSNVRRINYKKMAVVYTVHGRFVYIHRILPRVY
jgi:plasmid stabilization system protein ParE